MAVRVAQLINDVPNIGRKWRRPKHKFQLSHTPYTIQPFMLAPVLPGDTLKKGMFQARVVTDPINDALIGWWQEYYFFYVKLTDLEIRDSIPDLFLTEDYDHSGLNTAANVATYHAGGSIDWALECLKRVTAEYFRDEGEAWNTALGYLSSMPIATAISHGDNGLDSLIKDDDAPEAPDADDEIGELYGEQYAKWQAMAKIKLTNLTFEEYLERAYGVKSAVKTDTHRPELMRYVRSWSYPSNTINPTDGTPSSAVSWAIAERLDKNRYFKEPGFIFGVTVTRPKVYAKNQTGSLASLLTTGERWLPSVVLANGEQHTSVINVPSATGPLSAIVDDGGYWLDLADLFMYGDQFCNVAMSGAKSLVTLPTTTGSVKYPTAADIEALFKVGTSNKVRQDGVVDLRILSRITDTTK